MNTVRTSFKYENNNICIYEDIPQNTITIDDIDYFAYYIDPNFKKSKGANSYLCFNFYEQIFITLFKRQFFI